MLLLIFLSALWKQGSIIHKTHVETPRDLTGAVSFVEKAHLSLVIVVKVVFKCAEPNTCHQTLELNITKGLKF